MKFILLFSFFILNSGIFIFGQRPQKVLFTKFHSADSIIILSHLTEKIVKKGDNSQKLVVNDLPNYNMIKETFKLGINDIDSLARILMTLNKDTDYENAMCFDPHHGILIFKKGKCSYFDICFGCRHFATSKDITLSDRLSNKTWEKLELFFRNRKMNYEVPEDEIK